MSRHFLPRPLAGLALFLIVTGGLVGQALADDARVLVTDVRGQTMPAVQLFDDLLWKAAGIPSRLAGAG